MYVFYYAWGFFFLGGGVAQYFLFILYIYHVYRSDKAKYSYCMSKVLLYAVMGLGGRCYCIQ